MDQPYLLIKGANGNKERLFRIFDRFDPKRVLVGLVTTNHPFEGTDCKEDVVNRILPSHYMRVVQVPFNFSDVIGLQWNTVH
jgi:hypothetical protein